jgi:hypothetical protein
MEADFTGRMRRQDGLLNGRRVVIFTDTLTGEVQTLDLGDSDD